MVTIRLAEYNDFDFFFDLKSEEFNVFWTGGENKPQKEKLRLFFNNAVKNANDASSRKIYIIENEEGDRVGHLYIIPNGEEYDLATAICSKHGGHGYAKQAIKLGLEQGKKLGYKRMVSSIREDNIASMKAYSSCGVVVTDKYKEVYIPKLRKNVKMYIVYFDHEA